MVNHVIESKKVASISVCVYDCMVLVDCQSFNYDMDTNMCEINSENSQTAPEDIISTKRKIMFSDIKVWPKVRFISLFHYNTDALLHVKVMSSQSVNDSHFFSCLVF